MSLQELEKLLNAHTDATAAPTGANNPWVIIVDDDPGVRAALRFALKDMYQLRLCATAVEGVNAVDPEVSAVVLDIKMQGHDGFWAYKAIREKNHHVPIIFNSAHQDAKNPYEIINEYRPFGFVTKGGETDVLLKTVARAVVYSKELRDQAKAMDALQRIKEAMAKPANRK